MVPVLALYINGRSVGNIRFPGTVFQMFQVVLLTRKFLYGRLAVGSSVKLGTRRSITQIVLQGQQKDYYL